jgi:hypothetical protein
MSTNTRLSNIELLFAYSRDDGFTQLHEIAGSLVNISNEMESYLSESIIIEELDDAWRNVESVRDAILEMA